MKKAQESTALATRGSTTLVTEVCIVLLVVSIEVVAAFSTALVPNNLQAFASRRTRSISVGSAVAALFDSKSPDAHHLPDDHDKEVALDEEGNSKRSGNNDSMNAFQTKLYQDLMELVAKHTKYGVRTKDVQALTAKNSGRENTTDNNKKKKDAENDDYYYRIFTYQFFPSTYPAKNRSVLSCRGTMFLMNKRDDTPVRLASLPMEKFFNLNEKDSTSDLDFSTIEYATLKADGSLLSTYMDDKNQLCLKTLKALDSPHVAAVMEYLEKEQPKLKTALSCLAQMGYTIDMEYCSPLFRVNIKYRVPELHILSIRSHETGTYLSREGVISLSSDNDLLQEIGNPAHWIPRVTAPPDQTADKFWPAFVSSIATMEGIEGYVLTMATTGQRVKVKTDWYLNGKWKKLTQGALYEAACDKTTDDLRAKYHEDARVLNRIAAMEEFVERLYDDLSVSVENLYLDCRHLSKKEYIDACKRRLEKDNAKPKLTLAITRYVYGSNNNEGGEFNYYAWMKKNYRQLRRMDETAWSRTIVRSDDSPP